MALINLPKYDGTDRRIMPELRGESVSPDTCIAEQIRCGKHGWQSISKWESDDFDGVIPGPVQVAMEHLGELRSSR